ncbi:Uncharacterised protein [Achromobacter spanius]|uniref:hypothetical protein n=1 Tax=Achromobacter spanius TaxID=217203 RepID=UPI000C2BAB3D|nr:hypothetical protein [Achromobacter spanius]AUA58885.1 hypothetical protein CVS48_24465 [Achromobacter spanius]CAB3673543.1 hypothetical protein LMG5911_03605 [Achromobacter spanius]SPT38735.1 Uncharacterised protein [Achromobacter denitrificans]VEE58953.1 Uncharacterised protein [Achromobacter spanius]
MISSNHIETRHSRFADSVTEHARRTGAMPFIAYADKCAAAMAGIESLVGLLRWNQVNNDLDDGPEVLSGYDTDNLLGLIQVAAHALLDDAGHLSMWAQKHYVPEAER